MEKRPLLRVPASEQGTAERMGPGEYERKAGPKEGAGRAPWKMPPRALEPLTAGRAAPRLGTALGPSPSWRKLLAPSFPRLQGGEWAQRCPQLLPHPAPGRSLRRRRESWRPSPRTRGRRARPSGGLSRPVLRGARPAVASERRKEWGGEKIIPANLSGLQHLRILKKLTFGAKLKFW